MKKGTFILTIIFLSFTISLFSQKQATNWFFGDKTGLNFKNGYAEVLSSGSMTAEAGCSTISDKYGNLLFYTNGIKVWNKLHEIMPNGDSLDGNYGTNQNSIIIPKPANESIYYLFTIDTSGFKYSIIDISLNNGLGNVIQKNIKICDSWVITNKITAIQHCNSLDTWVIVHKRTSAEFLSFLITESGIDIYNPVESASGSIIMAEIGYLKASPSGDKIILPVNSSTILFKIFDFDNNTGIISNPMRIYKTDEIYMYGAAFSSDGKVLYVSTGGKYYQLLQFDLMAKTENELNNSVKLIGQGNIYALQLATDRKIYTACVNEPYIGIIHNPSLLGTNCLFENKAIFLNDGICKMGLPSFNQSYFFNPVISCNNACTGENTYFSFEYKSNIDSVSWLFENNEPNISTSFPFYSEYSYSEPGNYNVYLISYHCGTSDTISQFIRITDPPYIELGNDTAIFTGNTILLDAGIDMDEYIWNTGYTDRFMEVFNTGKYIAEVTKNTCKASDSIFI
ncbi:MAG: hypothetical protein K8R74_18395, partial [Bacteroidales bacterium]|nr:hypothetical protein [Bacteroidales bacterium]